MNRSGQAPGGDRGPNNARAARFQRDFNTDRLLNTTDRAALLFAEKNKRLIVERFGGGLRVRTLQRHDTIRRKIELTRNHSTIICLANQVIREAYCCQTDYELLTRIATNGAARLHKIELADER